MLPLGTDIFEAANLSADALYLESILCRNINFGHNCLSVTYDKTGIAAAASTLLDASYEALPLSLPIVTCSIAELVR
jgi:hypothetical protein